ncbi:hypothetical protein STEG23_032613, partial [Scotinomys teguina]
KDSGVVSCSFWSGSWCCAAGGPYGENKWRTGNVVESERHLIISLLRHFLEKNGHGCIKHPDLGTLRNQVLCIRVWLSMNTACSMDQ